MRPIWSLRNCVIALLLITVVTVTAGCDYFDRRPELTVNINTIGGNVGIIMPGIDSFKAVFEVSVIRGETRHGEPSTAPFNLYIDYGDGKTDVRNNVTADAFSFVHEYSLHREYLVKAKACWIDRECYESETRIMVKDRVDPQDSVCNQCFLSNSVIEATLTGPSKIVGNINGAKYVTYTITVYVKPSKVYDKIEMLYIALSADEEVLNIADWHQVLLPDENVIEIRTGRFYEFEATMRLRSFPGEGWIQADIEVPDAAQAAKITLRKSVTAVAPE